MRCFYILILSVTSFLMSCSSDEFVSSDEPSGTSDNIYFEFNKWVYFQMNQQYLWREDLPDSTDCDYDLPPRDFFFSLISSKDRFSYFTKNPNYKGSNYINPVGFAYQEYSDIYGNKALQVLYVNSINAKRAGLRRGDFVTFYNKNATTISLYRVLCIDGKFVNTNERVEFDVDEINHKASTVLVDSIYAVNNMKVGYLCYLEYGDIKDLEKPFQKFWNQNISELILDLRYNPGGYVSTCQFLCNCIVSQQAYGAVFQQCAYNNILSEYYLRTTGNERTFSYYNYPSSTDKESLGAKIWGLNLDRIIILTSQYTASASEATILCLKPYMEVVTVGEKTVGKGVGSWTIFDAKYQYAIQPITMRYFNAKGETIPDEGLVTDYYIADGFSTSKKEIGDLDESLLKYAIELLSGNVPQNKNNKASRKLEYNFTPLDEPSYVKDFKNRHCNESI